MYNQKENKTCTFCGASNTQKKKAPLPSVFLYDNDTKSMFKFTMEPKEGSKRMIVNSYHDGVLEAQIVQAKIIWAAGHIEDQGYVYDGKKLTKKKSEGSLTLSAESRRDDLTKMANFIRTAQIKLVEVGKPSDAK